MNILDELFKAFEWEEAYQRGFEDGKKSVQKENKGLVSGEIVRFFDKSKSRTSSTSNCVYSGVILGECEVCYIVYLGKGVVGHIGKNIPFEIIGHTNYVTGIDLILQRINENE